MRAVRFHDYTGLDGLRIENIPPPACGDDEALVRVHAAGVNPFDCYAVEGLVNGFVHFQLPAVLGRDFSGTVERIGARAASLSGFAVGDAVFGQADPASPGTFADYTAVHVSRLAARPASLSHVEAASLPNVILAAWNGLFSVDTGADLQPGQQVLVHGAAGGIGSVAVQLARWRGASVTGTASARNLGFLRELGAEHALDYTAPGWSDGPATFDAVLDTAGGTMAPALCGRLRPGGRYVSLRGLPEAAFVAAQAARGIRCVSASGPASLPDFPAMAAAIASGAVRPVVSAVHPLADVRAALDRVRDGHVRGKIVLDVAGAAGP